MTTITEIKGVINPNGQGITITERVIKEETEKEIVAQAEHGYVFRIKKEEIGVILDYSGMGGWLEIKIWLQNPTQDETEFKRSEVIRQLGLKVKKISNDADKLNKKFIQLL